MEDGPIELASLRGAGKRYGKVVALEGVDLSLRAGQVMALLGANGAGKSTAVALLLGLVQPDAGEAALFGRSPGRLDARRGAGVMLQSAALQETLKVRELLDLTRSYYPHPRSVADCACLGGLDGLLERRYGKLSGGQQRRVQFALAVCGNPRVLFLDEPTTGLDIEARQTLWRALRELVAQGCAVLLTTHYLEEAEALADRVTVLARGRVVAAGSMEDVRRHVSARRIRCRTSLDPACIAGWPQVRSVRAVEPAAGEVEADAAAAGATDAAVAGAEATGAAAGAAMAAIGARGDGHPGHGRSHGREEIEVVTDAAEAVVRRLLAGDAALSELEVQRAGLADAFLELTREHVPGDTHREAA